MLLYYNLIMKQIVAAGLVVLVMLLAYFGLQAYASAKAYEQSTQKLVVDKSAKKQAEFRVEELAEKLSLGYYKSEKKIAREKIEQEMQLHKERAEQYTIYAMVTLGIIVLSYFVSGLRVFTFFGGLSAMIVLYFGLFTPIMMVTIHKEVEYIGDVVFSFESKSLLGSVAKLWESGDIIVALVILLFSVLIPMVKTISLMFVAVVVESRFAHGIVKFFKMIGKWSMVDVFVVATLLVFLTGNGSDVSDAEVQVGIYYFLAYVIVSMLVSLSADKMLERAK